MTFRRRKWIILSELIDKIEEDHLLDNCKEDLRCVCYAPHLGYRSWIFQYKKEYVALFDAGNGHYTFHMPATRADILIGKIAEHIERIAYNKRKGVRT